MKLATRLFALVALLALLAGGFVWWQRTPDASSTPQYRLAKVERGPLASAVAASGTLNAVTTVQVGSQVSGQVQEVLADFNTPVRKGQIIARIDPATFELRVNQTRADLDAAQSAVAVQRSAHAAQVAERARVGINLAEAERDHERKASLVEKNFLSPAERDRARTLLDATREQLRAVEAQIKVSEAQVASALAAVKQREALVRQAEVDLERTIIRAPVDGTVILKNVDAGQTVAASLQAPVLFTIARDLHDMQVEAAIDEADVGRLRAGQQATFTVDAFPRRSFAGEILQIRKAPQAVQNVVSYVVVISAANPDLALLPGMTANVRVVVERRDNVLKVPNAALRFRPAGAGEAKPAAEPGTAAASPSGAPAQGAGAQALQQFRSRVIDELKLDDGQKTQLDAIFAEMRGRFIELREVQEPAERRRRAERLRSELRERVAGILRADQKPGYDRIIAEIATARGTGGSAPGRLWVLETGKPLPIPVRTGLSDGVATEILGDALKEGVEVIVGAAPPPQRSFLPRGRLF